MSSNALRYVILIAFLVAVASVVSVATNNTTGNHTTVIYMPGANSTANTTANNTSTNHTANDTAKVTAINDTEVIPVTDKVVNNLKAEQNTTPIINNNYVNVQVNNSIAVPATVQPTVKPDTTVTTDEKLQKITTVQTKTVEAPKVIVQKSTILKSADLYTGQLVKITKTEETKKGLELVDVNAGINTTTGKKTCEYVTIKNNNAFDMGLGGYVLYVSETETGIQLPNIPIGAGKTLKVFTVNGKPDTYDAKGYLAKYHLRLAKELYPDTVPVSIYLIEPNFGEAISEIETTVY